MFKVDRIGKKLIAAGIALAVLSGAAMAQEKIPEGGYEAHDGRRPQPTVVTPGTASTQAQAGKAPSDAIVLFDGTDLSKWQTDDGKPAPWKVVDGYIECVPHSGSIRTKDEFGDVQLHIEWQEPVGTEGRSQGRGNSGVFLQGLYELQVLDNYHAQTYPDGMAGAIYGQYPPLVNACRPQGQWQSYDVVFHVAKYKDGKVTEPARETALFNGVLVQDNVSLIGPTGHGILAKYPSSLSDKGPLQLQDHGNRIRYRNIWVRQLPEHEPPVTTKKSGEHNYEKMHH